MSNQAAANNGFAESVVLKDPDAFKKAFASMSDSNKIAYVAASILSLKSELALPPAAEMPDEVFAEVTSSKDALVNFIHHVCGEMNEAHASMALQMVEATK